MLIFDDARLIIDTVTPLDTRNFGELRPSAENPATQRKPWHRGSDPRLKISNGQKMLQTLLDENTVPRLHGVRVEAGKCQDPHADAW